MKIFEKVINGETKKRVNIDGVNYEIGVKMSDLTEDNTMLLCLDCGCEYSANPGDYFWMEDNDAFNCECGSETLILI